NALPRSIEEQPAPHLKVCDFGNGDDRAIGLRPDPPFHQVFDVRPTPATASVPKRTGIQHDDPRHVQPLCLMAATAASVAPGGSSTSISRVAIAAGACFANRSQDGLEKSPPKCLSTGRN